MNFGLVVVDCSVKMSSLTLDVTLDEDFSGMEKVILQLRPSWSASDIRMKPFTTGITNKIQGYFHKNDAEVRHL